MVTQRGRRGELRARDRARPGRTAPRRARTSPRRRRVDYSAGRYRREATRRLSRFRQGSRLAVAITGLFLLLWSVPAAEGVAAEGAQDTVPAAAAPAPAGQEPTLGDTAGAEAGRAVAEATGTLRELAIEAVALLPKLLIALAVLALAGIVARLIRPVLRRVLGQWQKAEALGTLVIVSLWIVALATGLSILAGDVRALVGSVGLIGLALSWALQGPIESFSAYLLNGFKGHYRVGDRIAVGDVFGDVYRIDVLTTTVWEAGGPDKPVEAAQPTGALTTFPNAELLRTSVINYTRDFPYVWDEVTVGVANESDLEYAIRVVQDVARREVGPAMEAPARTYRQLLEAARLAFDVSEEPQVFVSPTDAWMNLIVRYLVPARERRRWASALVLALSKEMAKPEHAGRIIGSYPVARIHLREQEAQRGRRFSSRGDAGGAENGGTTG